jgi:hypothetical protein
MVISSQEQFLVPRYGEPGFSGRRPSAGACPGRGVGNEGSATKNPRDGSQA